MSWRKQEFTWAREHKDEKSDGIYLKEREQMKIDFFHSSSVVQEQYKTREDEKPKYLLLKKF